MKEYKFYHVILIIFEALLVAVGFVDALYQTVDTFVSGSFGNSSAPSIIYMFMFAFIIIYALYGYKHKANSFRLAITTFLMADVLAIKDLLMGYTSIESTNALIILLLCASLVLMLIFSITFKHEQELSITIGVIAALIELFVGIYAIVLDTGDLSLIMSSQPLSKFIAVSALTLALVIRVQYRSNEKKMEKAGTKKKK
ncbi:MAG: hypothetical protein MJ145_01320 [Clostridia bacterium]|nr:hypothetical protein [Clostridia bacterium]